jgi:hypothetical protein
MDDDPEWLGLMARACELERAIGATPAEGVRGLAVKIFLREHCDSPLLSNCIDPCALNPLNPIAGERIADGLTRELVRDAVHFLPELAPLSVAITERPSEERGPPNQERRDCQRMIEAEERLAMSRRLYEDVARLVSEFLALAERAEQKAEPQEIGFGERAIAALMLPANEKIPRAA